MTKRPLTTAELERALAELLGMIHRLSPPLNHRPALFLEQKDALGRYVVDLQRRMGFSTSSPTSFSARQGDGGASHVRIPGRRAIPVERRRIGQESR